jgi:hypothetical protein
MCKIKCNQHYPTGTKSGFHAKTPGLDPKQVTDEYLARITEKGYKRD